MFLSIHSVKSVFEDIPTFVSISSPLLNSSIVGIPLIWNLPGVSGFSSTSSFPIVILSLYSSDISSSMGPICLQGPHHSAQKSTNIGSSEFLISSSKLLSVIISVRH